MSSYDTLGTGRSKICKYEKYALDGDDKHLILIRMSRSKEPIVREVGFIRVKT
jgi:hypothetical protein